jgi:hypothetical protein
MPMNNRVFAAVGALVAVLAIVAGVLTIDPPWTVRKVRLDSERAASLAALTESINRFARDKARLPQSLDELQQPAAGYQSYRPIFDPVTGVAYEYLAGTGLDYQVCAVFDLSSKGSSERQQAGWPHEAGRTCFSRTAPSK